MNRISWPGPADAQVLRNEVNAAGSPRSLF